MIKPEMFNYKDTGSFYNKTINMESATDYDVFVRNNGVRTKSILVKKQSTERRFMYVLEDVLCLAAYNEVKVDPAKKDFIREFWDTIRQRDDFFHSFYDDFTKDYMLSEVRGQKVECVSFHLLQSISYVLIAALEEELLNPDQDIANYANRCEYKCCKASATKEDRAREYSERKYKKMTAIERSIKAKKKPPVVIAQIPDSPKIFSRVRRWFNSFF